MKRLELAIESDLDNLSLIGVSVNRVCVQLGLSEVRAAEVELCVVEAVTNAIRHAYHGTPGYRVTVMLAATLDQLLIEVRDTGTPMTLESQARLFQGLNASDFLFVDRQSIPEGGRGLKIIHELMDNVSYVSEDSLNRLVMTKRL